MMYNVQGIKTFTMDEDGNYHEYKPELTEYVGKIKQLEYILDRFCTAKYCFPAEQSEEVLAKQYYEVIKQVIQANEETK